MATNVRVIGYFIGVSSCVSCSNANEANHTPLPQLSAGHAGAEAIDSAGGSGGLAGASSAGAAADASAGESGSGGAETVAPASPELLSATGLYANIATFTLAPEVRAFQPRFALWSDGATKQRWIQLPPSRQIDNSDADFWEFPVGTRFWKEFSINGVRVETRMIWRWGAGAHDFAFVTYQWNEAGTDARSRLGGAKNSNGTSHDIPAATSCRGCHGGHSSNNPRIRHVLGFGAIQLSHALAGVTLSELSKSGLLSVPHSTDIELPGDALAQRALGYLHANCGNCHNATSAELKTPFSLELLVRDRTLEETGAYRTAVNVPLEGFVRPGISARIAPGNVDASAIFFRMSVRGAPNQMPPVASELVDTSGLADVGAWIKALKPSAPPPELNASK